MAISLSEETKKLFPDLSSRGFDKGFYSPENKRALSEILNQVTRPKKGKLSKAEMIEENSEEFRQGKRRHSAIESAINGLESTGLDRCPDKGLPGFERYTALAVLARNIEILGVMLQKKARRSRDRRAKYNQTYRANRLKAA